MKENTIHKKYWDNFQASPVDFKYLKLIPMEDFKHMIVQKLKSHTLQNLEAHYIEEIIYFFIPDILKKYTLQKYLENK